MPFPPQTRQLEATVHQQAKMVQSLPLVLNPPSVPVLLLATEKRPQTDSKLLPPSFVPIHLLFASAAAAGIVRESRLFFPPFWPCIVIIVFDVYCLLFDIGCFSSHGCLNSLAPFGMWPGVPGLGRRNARAACLENASQVFLN